MTTAGTTLEVPRSVSLRLLALVAVILGVLFVGLVAVVVLAGPPLVDWLANNLPIARFALAATGVIVLTIPTAFLIIYLELKVIARMNLRVGPDRVGPFGALQSVAHGLKVLTKEDFTPTNADKIVFTWAPVAAFLGSIMTLVVVPFAPGLYGQDFKIGLLYFFAMGGLGVVGLLMAGWSSFNKYSLLGGLRAAAQVISYEIPLTLSIVGIVMLAGTLSLVQITDFQAGTFLNWFIFKQPLGFLIFCIAATAEANRTPLDMAEADQEIVAGFATEYSGMRFGFFFFAEYVNVFIMSAMAVTLFLGGYNAPFGWPWPVHLNFDLTTLGLALPIGIVAIPVVGAIVLGLPFSLVSSRISVVGSLILGLVLTVLLSGAALFGVAFVNLDWLPGVIWFFAKTYVLVFTFVWMRGTLPRVRIDQLMGFAWKWLLPASLLNLFVTALAIIIFPKLGIPK